jgi:hypothetical protein
MTMTNASLIQIRRTGFRIAGQGRGQGLALLYQDKLARVSRRAEAVGTFLGPFALVGIVFPYIHEYGLIAAAAGVFAGRWVGEQVDRRIAVRRVAQGGRGVTVIPLDSITSVRAGSEGFLGIPSMFVTTQDGTEYRFYGRPGTWQADLVAALTVRGRSVQVTPEGIAVTPPPPED